MIDIAYNCFFKIVHENFILSKDLLAVVKMHLSF